MWFYTNKVFTGLFYFGPHQYQRYFHQDILTSTVTCYFIPPGSESDIQAWDSAAGKFSFYQQAGERVNDPDQWDQQTARQEQVNGQNAESTRGAKSRRTLKGENAKRIQWRCISPTSSEHLMTHSAVLRKPAIQMWAKESSWCLQISLLAVSWPVGFTWMRLYLQATHLLLPFP